MINTRFWDDNYTSNLDPIEKLLFLYVLTNTSTNICGVYEIPIKKVASETGLDKDMVMKVLERFAADNKIYYSDGWMIVKNFAKNQNLNSLSVKKGIESELKKVPDHIKKIFIGDGGGMVSNLTESNLTELNLTKDSAVPARDESLKESNKAVADIIERFSLLNDNYKKFFANTTQRKAAEELFENYGLEKVAKAIYMAKFAITDNFFPNFITPYELRTKWPKVKRYYAGKNAKDKRWLEEFTKYTIDMEKLKTKDDPKQVVTKNIGGRTISYELTGKQTA